MKKLTHFILLATCIFAGGECFPADPSVKSEVWGKMPDSREVSLFTLTNEHGTRVRVAEYGALLVSLETPDRNGKLGNITLSYPTLDDALKGGVFGSVIGRFANRISDGGFTIDGVRYDLETVNPKTNVHIHGGKNGFHRQLWKTESTSDESTARVTFHLKSPDGEEGYPGNVEVWTTYELTADNVLRISYRGTSDKKTPLNLTNHAYFNLAGTGDIREQILTLQLWERLEIDDRNIPTGEILPVSDTPFDLRKPTRLGDRLPKIERGGFDHCFVIAKISIEQGPTPFATLRDPGSGRVMHVATTKPGVQIYTANHFKGKPYPKWGGICFETQYYPDSPNQGRFPSSILRADQAYDHTTEFRFETEK
ncbi:galactose mutarotase [Verrucomicrobiales bacterium]|jgi:aldose 1-epimerase|nr:galactose mutarotase [Verrucomicrobiales bacterium]MDC0262712.1 galactose mutarotase [Verrucomicrobiales bacterium]MDC0263376.1 galactose mutarotase [bacterium]